jgi:ribosome-associated protein
MKLVNTVNAGGASSSSKPETTDAAGYSADDVLNAITACLDDAKAENMATIDIKGKSALGDYMVVVSGRSHRHVAAMSEQLLKEMKTRGFGPVKVEGQQAADWVLIDTGDVIVHIFRPEVREFYGIEKMWMMPEQENRH